MFSLKIHLFLLKIHPLVAIQCSCSLCNGWPGCGNLRTASYKLGKHPVKHRDKVLSRIWTSWSNKKSLINFKYYTIQDKRKGNDDNLMIFVFLLKLILPEKQRNNMRIIIAHNMPKVLYCWYDTPTAMQFIACFQQ